MTPFDSTQIRSAATREHYEQTKRRHDEARERMRDCTNRESRGEALSDSEVRRFADDEAEVREAAAELRRIESTAELGVLDESAELRSAALGDKGRRYAAGSTQVISEPLTYSEHTRYEHSFFRDIRSAMRDGDQDARDRLNRHRQETRSMSVGSATGGGNMTIPNYLHSLVTDFVRARAPLYAILPKTPIISPTQFRIPKLTQGTEVDKQSSENAALNSQDPTVAQLTVDPITIGAYNTVSQQLLDSSVPFIDQVIYRDLAAAMAGKKEYYIISGSGSSQPRGLLNLSSPGGSTYDDASPTAGELFGAVGEAVKDVATANHVPSHILLHTGTWAWWLSRTDADGRPVIGGLNPQSAQAASDGAASVGAAGEMFGCQVVTSNRVPTGLGGSTNQTRVSVFDAERLMVFDSTPRIEMSNSNNEDFQNFSVTFRIASYFGFVVSHDDAVSNVSGTGLIYPPTF